MSTPDPLPMGWNGGPALGCAGPLGPIPTARSFGAGAGVCRHQQLPTIDLHKYTPPQADCIANISIEQGEGIGNCSAAGYIYS